MEYVKICKGIAAVGSVSFQFQYGLPSAVNSRGAVSPATRAKANMMLVTMPDMAEGTTTDSVVRHCGMPRPRAASRMADDTVRGGALGHVWHCDQHHVGLCAR